MSDVIAVGDLITGLEVGTVAHGGHFIARHEGQVIFVRHALTGELVDVRVTEKSKRFAPRDRLNALRTANESAKSGSTW